MRFRPFGMVAVLWTVCFSVATVQAATVKVTAVDGLVHAVMRFRQALAFCLIFFLIPDNHLSVPGDCLASRIGSGYLEGHQAESA